MNAIMQQLSAIINIAIFAMYDNPAGPVQNPYDARYARTLAEFVAMFDNRFNGEWIAIESILVGKNRFAIVELSQTGNYIVSGWCIQYCKLRDGLTIVTGATCVYAGYQGKDVDEAISSMKRVEARLQADEIYYAIPEGARPYRKFTENVIR